MYDIHAPQIKAARALLDWSQEDLARSAKLSVSTVRTIELGFVPKDGTIEKVFKALEEAGIELTDGEGVRRRAECIRTFTGPDSPSKFFAEVARSATGFNGEILVLMLSDNLWLNACGSNSKTNLQRLEIMRALTGIKCLCSEGIKVPPEAAAIQFQYLPESILTFLQSSTIIYANKYAMMWEKARGQYTFVEFDIPANALAFRKQFLAIWEKLRK